MLRSDNGPEFVSRALLRWAGGQNLDMVLIDPGKPWQNGTAESVNGKFHDAWLSMEWLRNRLEAKVVIEQWRCQHKAIQPQAQLRQRERVNDSHGAACSPTTEAAAWGYTYNPLFAIGNMT